MSDPQQISAVVADEGFGYEHYGARSGGARWCDICDADRPDRVGAMRWYPALTGTAQAVHHPHDALGEFQKRETDAPDYWDYWVVDGLDAQHDAYIDSSEVNRGAEACPVEER